MSLRVRVTLAIVVYFLLGTIALLLLKMLVNPALMPFIVMLINLIIGIGIIAFLVYSIEHWPIKKTKPKVS